MSTWLAQLPLLRVQARSLFEHKPSYLTCPPSYIQVSCKPSVPYLHMQLLT